jgi:hypothetical protein
VTSAATVGHIRHGLGGRGEPAITGYQLMIGCRSAQGWTYAKRRLDFGKVPQDGDEEGSIMLDRLPSKAEARGIRYALGIPKRIELSEGQFANLRAHAAVNAFKPVLPASLVEKAE